VGVILRQNVSPERNPSVLRWLCVTSIAAGFLVVVACGSNSPSSSQGGPDAAASDGGAFTLTNCPSQGVASAACSSCIEKSCAADRSAVNASCADYYACLCPTGANAAACTPSAACTTALTDINDDCSCPVCAASPVSDGGGYSVTNCPALGVAAACVSCLQESCAAQVTSIDTSCQSLLACACPPGATPSSCTPAVTCELELYSALSACTTCNTVCGAATEAGSDASEPVESGSDGETPTDAGPDATVASADGSAPLDAGFDAEPSDGGDGAVASHDASPDAAPDALAPAEAGLDASVDASAPAAEAGPEAAATGDVETEESDGGSAADGG
jgi:hypothetical protein